MGLAPIGGNVPSIRERPQGCAFAPRCALAIDRCRAERPPLVEVREGHAVRCWVRASPE
jgi:peptide/nickel transport system ATP-binding protein